MTSFYTAFADHYEKVFPVREPAVAFLLDAVPPGARVLDLGCGPGHHCGRLAAADRQPEGLDLDVGMIRAARGRYPGIPFHVGDLAALSALPGSWDAAYCIGNVASHVDDEGTAGWLTDLAARMSPGAPLVVQTVDWDALAGETFHRFADLDLGGGAVFAREYRDLGPERTRFLTRLVVEGRTLFAGEVELYPRTAAAWRDHFVAAGFDVKGHFADFARAPYPAGGGGSVWLVHRR
ncbi:MAG: class I SAM-dependent methyltransferase [bacterium]|nr:class I SAM-dependent methyltransferase [bacterium]